jgi:uncharacterized cupin superfamily protein
MNVTEEPLTIQIEYPTPARLKDLDVFNWPVWKKGVSTFDWSYEDQEICYILEGRARVRTPLEAVELRPGQLVTFPKGLQCVWTILESLQKHYHFG